MMTGRRRSGARDLVGEADKAGVQARVAHEQHVANFTARLGIGGARFYRRRFYRRHRRPHWRHCGERLHLDEWCEFWRFGDFSD